MGLSGNIIWNFNMDIVYQLRTIITSLDFKEKYNEKVQGIYLKMHLNYINKEKISFKIA